MIQVQFRSGFTTGGRKLWAVRCGWTLSPPCFVNTWMWLVRLAKRLRKKCGTTVTHERVAVSDAGLVARLEGCTRNSKLRVHRRHQQLMRLNGAVRGAQALITRAHHLRRQFGLDALPVTRSEQGMSLFIENQPPMRLPTHAREVFDVTSAGDTVAGVIRARLAAGLGLAEAVVLENIAAGIVVAKMGTAGFNLVELTMP